MIRIREVGPVEDVAMATSPLGRPLYWAHCFRVGNLLVDSGHFWMRDKFGQWLRTRAIDSFFLTHHHEDHAGNARLAAHILGFRPLAHDKALEPLGRTEMLWPFQFAVWGPRPPVEAEPAPERIQTEDGDWLVVHAPGHSPDHAVLVNPGLGLLAAGDGFIGPRLRYLRDDEDFNRMIESTARMLELEFDTALCGLAGVVADAKPILARKLQWMEDVRGRVLELHAKGWPDLLTARRVFGPENGMTLATTGRYSRLNFVRSILGR